MTGATILTPIDLAVGQKVGRRRWWKQVLPVTTIDYEGRKINFDPAFHTDLSEAYKAKAFDQVPLVFANGDNQHNMDPRNFGGEVLDMSYRGPGKDQGTWALIEADEDTAKVIDRNPKLGVSARIRQGIAKADGRTFNRAIEHICLTMNPRVTGMSPWQAVDLSEGTDNEEVVDLTTTEYQKGTDMARGSTKAKTARPKIDLSALSDEQFQSLLDLSEAVRAGVEDDEVDPDDIEDDDLEDSGEGEDQDGGKPPKKKKAKTRITVEEDSTESGGDDKDEDDEDDEDGDADLSDATAAQRSADHDTVRQMQIDLAEQRWSNERSTFVRAGVPPFLLDLAEPVLSSPDAFTIDLSDTETINAGDTIRKMLDGVKGLIDMTPEIGHQIDLSDSGDGDDNDPDQAFIEAWDKQYGR